MCNESPEEKASNWLSGRFRQRWCEFVSGNSVVAKEAKKISVINDNYEGPAREALLKATFGRAKAVKRCASAPLVVGQQMYEGIKDLRFVMFHQEFNDVIEEAATEHLKSQLKLWDLTSIKEAAATAYDIANGGINDKLRPVVKDRAYQMGETGAAVLAINQTVKMVANHAAANLADGIPRTMAKSVHPIMKCTGAAVLACNLADFGKVLSGPDDGDGVFRQTYEEGRDKVLNQHFSADLLDPSEGAIQEALYECASAQDVDL